MRSLFIILAMALSSALANAQVAADSVGVWSIHDGTPFSMELIKMEKVKGTGGLGFALTGGLSKIKAKLVFDGAKSENRFKGEAKIRIYFGNPPLEKMIQLYMFTPTYGIKDFGIGEFETKKTTRQLVTMRAGLLGTDMGANKADDVSVEKKELRPGVYELTIKGNSGEYCLMHIVNGYGGYGGVFDFAIE